MGLCVYLSSVKQFMSVRWITSNFIAMQMTQKRKHNKWLQFLSGEDITETPLERERWLDIQREQRRRRRQQETSEQREHRLA